MTDVEINWLDDNCLDPEWFIPRIAPDLDGKLYEIVYEDNYGPTVLDWLHEIRGFAVYMVVEGYPKAFHHDGVTPPLLNSETGKTYDLCDLGIDPDQFFTEAAPEAGMHKAIAELTVALYRHMFQCSCGSLAGNQCVSCKKPVCDQCDQKPGVQVNNDPERIYSAHEECVRQAFMLAAFDQ